VPTTNNDTRWTSKFAMVNDILNLQEPYEIYINLSVSGKGMQVKDKTKLEECRLSDDEWEELREIHALLHPFWLLTMKMQGNIVNRNRDDPSNSFETTVHSEHDSEPPRE